MDRIVYLCEDTPDGIFTAIYDAWAAKLPDDLLSLRVERNYTMELFTQCRYVQTDMEKAVKVARSVKGKISPEAYYMIYNAALSFEVDKIDCIYHFLKMGFQYGADVVQMHGEDVVCRMFELKRNVGNESHMFREILRFHDSDEGILIAKLHPKNQVLPLIAEHFSDRFPEEHFVILDEVHEMGLFHEKGKQWYLAPLEREILEKVWHHRASTEYEKLWKTFFDTIAIEERKNYKCQRNMCSLRYRDYMVEFH